MSPFKVSVSGAPSLSGSWAGHHLGLPAVAARPGAVGMPYVVFAGNVGNEESLLQAIDQLEAPK